MAITGAHVLLYTSQADALRRTLREVFGWKHVDAGDGWLIFALPPAELAAHPTDGAPKHELCFMCDDIGATLQELRSKGVDARGEPEDHGFGVGLRVVLPGGVEVFLYEPRHPTAV